MQSGTRPGPDRRSGLRAAILEAALEDIGDCDLDDLLKCLTPARLARDRAFSPSTIRYHFGRGPSRFDREALAAALVELLTARLTDHARSAAAGYTQALDAVRGGADGSVVEAALARDLEPFVPGPSGAQATANARLYLLAVAMCDSSGHLTSQLRTMREEVLDSYDRVYATFLQAAGRRMAAGTTLRDLTVAINALLEGLTVLGRQHAGMHQSGVVDTVVRILWAFTVGEEEAGADDNPVQALLASLR